jgi:hypothetical protein
MEQISATGNGPAVHCNIFEHCRGNHPENEHCWEIARAKGDFHYVFNVCSDCIVYLYEQNSRAVSRKDIEQILQHRRPGTGH